MKRLFYLSMTTFLGVGFVPRAAPAQTVSELHAGYEKYWKEDISRLKKISVEKDSHAAAQEVTRMKDEMLPQLEKLVRMSQEWKLAHSREENMREQEWALNNPLSKEAGSLQTDMMIRGSTQGGELANAWRDYMRAMATMMKRSR